jgi:demethylmenaquinone methyltransferase/2-methoxy-6-polyprenyl-1,4-benzoquinol methylase
MPTRSQYDTASPQVSSFARPEDKAAAVRRMFDRIAPRYDLFNDLLSAGIHRRWRERAVNTLAPRPGRRYLDLCAGTLELAAAIRQRTPSAWVGGLDFSLPMLTRGAAKLGPDAPPAVVGDALRLPFADRTFAGCTIAFGLRNLADFASGLAEMRRVLEPGGRLVVLEFTTPPGPLFRKAYHLYFHHVLPVAGGMIAGDRTAARYLPESVAEFPDGASLAALVRGAGFAAVRYGYLTRGIAALHTGVRA